MSDYRQRAACHGADPEAFFPTTLEDAGVTIHRYCMACPVLAECAADGLSIPGTQGIWGGQWLVRDRGLSGTTTKPRSGAAAAIEARRVELIDRGMTLDDIAEMEGVTIQGVRLWWKRYADRLRSRQRRAVKVPA